MKMRSPGDAQTRLNAALSLGMTGQTTFRLMNQIKAKVDLSSIDDPLLLPRQYADLNRCCYFPN